jgi:hypothetical protein
MNMIHTTCIWMFMLPILGVFIDYGNGSYNGVDASTLVLEE